MGEILTVDELASLLKMNRRQIYSMTESRTRAKQKHPLPFVRVNGNLRFDKVAVTEWWKKLQEAR
ncbi:MAG TPA: helix-turn-helix domain-containing protein [Terriglobales bacterium]|nr:helix-turn-helix domain-containing protein [Terriglobales bacterium]